MVIPRPLFLLPLILSAVACSSSSSAPANTPPVVDSVTGPTAPLTAQNGQYTIPIVIRFHDADNDAITTVHYRIPTANVDQTVTIPSPNPQAIGAELTLLISGNVPKQTYDFTVSVIDARGAESAAATAQATLQ